MPKRDDLNEREPMTTDELQKAVARVAVNLDQARGLLVQARDEGAKEWPKEMVNEEAQPSLEYRVDIDIQMLLEEYVEPGLALARDTSSLTNARVTREWQADRDTAVRGAAEMAALFTAPANDEDNPVPYFLEEVAVVMTAAHTLRGKKKLSDEERATLSRAIRLQAALLGEESLESYIRRVLDDKLPAPLDEAEGDLRIPVRQALTSLSKSALAFSAMLRKTSDLGLDSGIGQEHMASITEAIEELARQVAALEPTEDV